MGKDPERRLRERLARVEALHRGATTDGEREAAAKALERVALKIVEVRSKDEVARFCAAHVASLGVPGRRNVDQGGRAPTAAEIRAMLLAWTRGDVSRRRVRAWAQKICDRVVFPADPMADGACRGELLLQLADLDRIGLTPADVPAMLAFLDHRDWHAWFELLATAARSSRRSA